MRARVYNPTNSPFDLNAAEGLVRLPSNGEVTTSFDPRELEAIRGWGVVEVHDEEPEDGDIKPAVAERGPEPGKTEPLPEMPESLKEKVRPAPILDVDEVLKAEVVEDKPDPLDHDGDKRKGGSLKGKLSTAAKGARRRKAAKK